MKKELSDAYDINVDKMINIKKPVGDFKVKTSEFGRMYKKGFKKMDILVSNRKQIFKMNDGKYILEIENDYSDPNDSEWEIKYYYSENVKDLI